MSKYREVKIGFKGPTGSGKTLLARLVREALEAKGLTARSYIDEPEIAGFEDVLTVEVGHDGIMKLLGMKEAAE